MQTTHKIIVAMQNTSYSYSSCLFNPFTSGRISTLVTWVLFFFRKSFKLPLAINGRRMYGTPSGVSKHTPASLRMLGWLKSFINKLSAKNDSNWSFELKSVWENRIYFEEKKTQLTFDCFDGNVFTFWGDWPPHFSSKNLAKFTYKIQTSNCYIHAYCSITLWSDIKYELIDLLIMILEIITQ